MISAILAKGKSLRLNTFKPNLKVGKRSLLERVYKGLNCFFDEVIIVTDTPDLFKEYMLKFKNIEVVEDKKRGCGPLGGIYTSLLVVKKPFVFITACDFPFILTGLIKYFSGLISGYDVVVPKVNGKIQTLFGFYSKSCLPKIESALKEGKYKISDVLQELKVKYIREQEVAMFGNPQIYFLNLNVPNDLKKANKIAENFNI